MSNDVSSSSSPTRRGTDRISPSAVLGTLFLLAASVAFGILGPRMGQRGVRMSGTPLIDLQQKVLLEFRSSLDGFGNGERREREVGESAPDLSALDIVFEDEEKLEMLGTPVTVFRYRDEGSGSSRPLQIFRVSEPRAFIRSDALGRQLPVLSGVRIEETVDIGLPGFLVGLVILGFEEHASIVVTLGLDRALDVANLIDPPVEPDSEEVSETLVTILGDPARPMKVG